jgi:hypothetical protein
VPRPEVEVIFQVSNENSQGPLGKCLEVFDC